MRKIIPILLAVVLVVTLVFSLQASYSQKTGGGYSTVTTVTERSRAWILERFGGYETLPELLQAIDDFGCENFVYQLWDWGLVQEFDLDRFLFAWDYRGVCFDFSCFVKSVVTVWSEAKGRSDVQAYVYDVRLKDGGNHSYNFIFEEGHTWFLCLTTDVARAARGEPVPGFHEVKDASVEACLARWQDEAYNMN